MSENCVKQEARIGAEKIHRLKKEIERLEQTVASLYSRTAYLCSKPANSELKDAVKEDNLYSDFTNDIDTATDRIEIQTNAVLDIIYRMDL